MRPPDTSPEVQRIMDEHYRQMTPAEKGAVLRRAWRTARALQMTGLRSRYRDESEDQLSARLAENWLGTELFNRVKEWQASIDHDR